MARLIHFAAIAALFVAAPVRADAIDGWQPYIAEASARFSVPVSWIERVIRAESGGYDRLNGRPVRSPKGAMGLMQLMPATWASARSILGLGSDPYDPRENILAGTFYLRQMYDRFGYPGCFAAYNAGPGRYAAALAGRQSLPIETIAYLGSIGAALRKSAIQVQDRAAELVRRAEQRGRSARQASTATAICWCALRDPARGGMTMGREWARLDSPSMTGGEAAIKARGCPPICCANRFPPRPLRGASADAPATLTAAPPPVFRL